MPSVSVLDLKGKKTGTVKLNDDIFAIKPNEAVIHFMVVNYLAAQRQGTQSTLTRSEVSGGGKKPWRQKGTGRARQGSTRAPQWRHGGVALGPKPRKYDFSVNKKVRRLGMKSAFSVKANLNEIKVLDIEGLSEIKTKTVADFLKAAGVTGKTLFVLPEKNDVFYRSSRNIEGVKTTLVNTLNVYDIMNCDNFIVIKDAVKKIEEVYA
ncbi:MAG: 50S ribosomal protein L4 [Clostridia bacterium]|nr:50S ribosomal protein L4 [Clostridia bacterium]